MKLQLRIISANELYTGQEKTQVWFREGGSIARMPSNDGVLPNSQSEIARVHARIYYENEPYYIENLSANGVFLNDRKHCIDRFPHLISQVDSFFIGQYEIQTDLIKSSIYSDSKDSFHYQHETADKWLDDSIDIVMADFSKPLSSTFQTHVNTLSINKLESSLTTNEEQKKYKVLFNGDAMLVAQKAALKATLISAFDKLKSKYIDNNFLEKGDTRDYLIDRFFNDVFHKGYLSLLYKHSSSLT